LLAEESARAARALCSIDSHKVLQEAFLHWAAQSDDELLSYGWPGDEKDFLPSPRSICFAPHFSLALHNAKPGHVVFSSEPPGLAQWQHEDGWEWVQAPASKDLWVLIRPGMDFWPDGFTWLHAGFHPGMSPEEKNGWALCHLCEQDRPRSPIFFNAGEWDLDLPWPPRGLCWHEIQTNRFVLRPRTFESKSKEPFAFMYRSLQSTS